MKKVFQLVAFLFFLGYAKTLSASDKNYAIHISLFNESTAIPFTRFFTTPIHPGLQIGTEFTYLNKKRSRLFQTVNAYYYYHRYLAHGVGLSSDLGYEYRFPFGLSFSALFGVGYLHTVSTAKEYTLKDGTYILKKDRGNPRVTASLSLEIGCYVKPSKPTSPKLFLRYQSWVEYPYSPGFIPLMTHINLHVGTLFYISKKSKK